MKNYCISKYSRTHLQDIQRTEKSSQIRWKISTCNVCKSKNGYITIKSGRLNYAESLQGDFTIQPSS